jgi:hypothetical protein
MPTDLNNELYFVPSLNTPRIKQSLLPSAADNGQQVLSDIGLKNRAQEGLFVVHIYLVNSGKMPGSTIEL